MVAHGGKEELLSVGTAKAYPKRGFLAPALAKIEG